MVLKSVESQNVEFKSNLARWISQSYLCLCKCWRRKI